MWIVQAARLWNQILNHLTGHRLPEALVGLLRPAADDDLREKARAVLLEQLDGDDERRKFEAAKSLFSTASCRHSRLAIEDRRLFLVYAARAPGSGRIGEGVVEGVDRIGWRDFNLTARAGCQVADGELHSVAFGVPEEKHLVRAA